MPRFKVVAPGGESKVVEAGEALSVMEAIRGAGFDDLLALCGGGCSCGTCHIYIDNAAMGRLPAIADGEDLLLTVSEHRQPNSRLACQLRVTAALDGAVLTIAPEG